MASMSNNCESFGVNAFAPRAGFVRAGDTIQNTAFKPRLVLTLVRVGVCSLNTVHVDVRGLIE